MREVHPVVAVDPGRVSGVACAIPSWCGDGRIYLQTFSVRVDPGTEGFLRVRDALFRLQGSVVAAGWKLADVEFVVEVQHVRFANSALVVTEIRRLWEVYAFEAFGCGPAQVHPSEWRSFFGLNQKDPGAKKKGAEKVFGDLMGDPAFRVFESGSSPRKKRTVDEVEAALMAFERLGVRDG